MKTAKLSRRPPNQHNIAASGKPFRQPYVERLRGQARGVKSRKCGAPREKYRQQMGSAAREPYALIRRGVDA